MPVVEQLAFQKPQLKNWGEKSPLSIVGNHSSAQHLMLDGDIWVFNGKGATLPRYTAVFQMHQPCDWGGGWSQRWLKENITIPVYMRKVYPEVPMAIRYPFEEVYNLLDIKHRGNQLKYFTSSIAYALALAILQERPRIDLYGLDMTDDEYKQQKDCFAFWVGVAAGRGIEININCADNIFCALLYGEESPRS